MQSAPIDPRSPVAVQRAISDWDIESWGLDDEGIRKVETFLADEAEDFEIRFTVDIPGPRPTLAELTRSLESINRRVTLALILTFRHESWLLQYDRYFFLEPYNYDDPWVAPKLKVEEISVGSAEITISGTKEEIRDALGFPHSTPSPAPITHKKRLLGAMFYVSIGAAVASSLGGSGPTIDNSPVSTPVEIVQDVTQDMNRACGLLRPGTTFTVKTPYLEMTVPCSPKETNGSQHS